MAGTGSVVVDATVAVLVILEPGASPKPTTTVMVNVTEAPEFIAAAVHVTVPLAFTPGELQVNAGVPDCVNEEKPVPAGTGCVTVTLFAVDGPLFVTVIVYVMIVPGMPGPPAVTVTDRSDAAGRVTLAVAELLPGTVSALNVDTVAVFDTVVPASEAPYAATSVNCAEAPEANGTGSVQPTVPFVPGGGVEQLNVGPVFCTRDTNVIPAGSASPKPTVSAASGPALATVMV